MTPGDGWQLERRVLEFVRAARAAGFAVSPADGLSAVQAVHAVQRFRPDRVRSALRSVLCRSRSDWDQFDAFFAQWFERGAEPALSDTEIQGVATPASGQSTTPITSVAPPADAATVGAADTSDALINVDLGTVFDPVEMRRIDLWIDAFVKRVKRQLHRRHRAGMQGRVQFSQTLRGAHATGGEPFKLAYQQRQRRLPHLVIFVDVSSSMASYAQFFLRFAKGLASEFSACHVYAFDTELIPLGDFVRAKPGVPGAPGLSVAWRGGTRIAKSLETFLDEHAEKTLRKRSTVIVLSDGYDTAAPDQLAMQLRTLRGQVKRLVWLHPLLVRESGPALDPSVVQSMASIDKLLPAHSLAALSALAAALR